MDIKQILNDYVFQEWTWTAIGFLGASITFYIGMKSGNKISKDDFIYRINSDFANNEFILKAYGWLDKCRKDNESTHNYRKIKGVFGKHNKIDFPLIDSYSNHFESVYVIRKVISMKTIDKLFQQRFLFFMHNPYVQKDMFFRDYESYENLFSLLDEWLRISIKRHGRSSKIMSDYLREFTIGDYEYQYYYDGKSNLSRISNFFTERQYLNNIRNYVPCICNPKCKYGYYSLSNKKNEQNLVVRIIRSFKSDVDDIIALQDKVQMNMDVHEWYYPYTREELEKAVPNKDCILLQIDAGQKIVAFAVAILNPPDEYRLSDLVKYKSSKWEKEAVLETVFVDKDYRGYGMQSLLIDILSHLVSERKATTFWASVHPDNIYSSNNFIKNGFVKMTKDGPVPKYDGVRDIYCRNLKRIGKKDKHTGEQYYYPY